MSTTTVSELHLSPPLTVARSDHGELTRLALAGTGYSSDAAEDLLHELERARIVADEKVPDDVVRMGSRLRFRTGRDERQVTLTWPAEADIASRRISVLTPVGTALIGLRAGQSISFRTRDGRPQMLTVLKVLPPAAGDDDDGDDDGGPQAA